MTHSLLSWAAYYAFVAYKKCTVVRHEPHLDPSIVHEMASPIHVNPSAAVRRLTIGGSDWLWVVFTIMILSAVATFVWAKVVSLFPWFSARRVFNLGSLPKATSRNASVSLSRRSHPHGVIVIILCYGIRLGGDDRQNRVQARGNT